MSYAAYWPEFALLAGAHIGAVISPGPDFLVTLKQSVQRGLHSALWTALGIGSGILVHISYVILGVAVFLRYQPVLFRGLQYLGVVYLLWLAWHCLRSNNVSKLSVEHALAPPQTPLKAYALGFLTNVLNPKATLFFLALYTSVVSRSTPVAVQVFYGLWMALTTALWFSFVSYVMVRPQVRLRFLSYGPWLDRCLGVLLLLVAMRLLFL